jgi:hypothetical protein
MRLGILESPLIGESHGLSLKERERGREERRGERRRGEGKKEERKKEVERGSYKALSGLCKNPTWRVETTKSVLWLITSATVPCTHTKDHPLESYCPSKLSHNRPFQNGCERKTLGRIS